MLDLCHGKDREMEWRGESWFGRCGVIEEKDDDVY